MSAACPPPIATDSPVNAAPAARISRAATRPVRSAVPHRPAGCAGPATPAAPVLRSEPTSAPAVPTTNKVQGGAASQRSPGRGPFDDQGSEGSESRVPRG